MIDKLLVQNQLHHIAHLILFFFFESFNPIRIQLDRNLVAQFVNYFILLLRKTQITSHYTLQKGKVTRDEITLKNDKLLLLLLLLLLAKL